MIMTASKDDGLGKRAVLQTGICFPVPEGIFKAAVLRGTASMILLSLPQRHFLFYPFFICQAAFKQQICMRKT